MHLEETKLPGIGLRHDFATLKGRRVGVISKRDGSRSIAVYSKDDPDACQVSVELTAEECEALAELLGAPRVIERLARLREQVEGLATDKILIAEGSPYAGRTLADAAIRSRTGASVVAVVRRDEVVPSPTPDFVFAPRDKVIVVGTEEGVTATRSLLGAG